MERGEKGRCSAATLSSTRDQDLLLKFKPYINVPCAPHSDSGVGLDAALYRLASTPHHVTERGGEAPTEKHPDVSLFSSVPFSFT